MHWGDSHYYCPRILTQQLLIESLGNWTHKTQRSWQLATHFNPYEIRFLDWWSYLDTGTHLCSDISVVAMGERKQTNKQGEGHLQILIHNTQSLQYVQGDSARKFRPSVVHLCSTSVAQIGQFIFYIPEKRKKKKNKTNVVVVKNWVYAWKNLSKIKALIFLDWPSLWIPLKINIERILS